MASGDLERLWERHIADSLRALPLVESAPPGPAVDVGSGGGFPGIPLAVAGGRHWTLVEPRHKRAGFLEEAVRVLELDCEVVVARAEEIAADNARARFAVATARALAPPRETFELLLPLLEPGGVAIVFVGHEAVIPPDAVEPEPGLAIMTRTGN